MKYNNRNYPHPVLGISDDVNGEIYVELSVATDKDWVKLTPRFVVNNTYYLDLLAKEQAALVTHVYCRGTMYREAFSSTNLLSEAINIRSSRINGLVEVDFFVCAAQEINAFNSTTFNPDYFGYNFALTKGDIIGYAGKGSFYANKSPEELKAVSSIMEIVNTEKPNHPMYNDYTGKRIAIRLCKEDFELYQELKRNRPAHILISTIVLPSLIDALYFLASSESNQYSDLPWHELLTARKAKSKNNENPFALAQEVLELPTKRALQTLKEILEEE